MRWLECHLIFKTMNISNKTFWRTVAVLVIVQVALGIFISWFDLPINNRLDQGFIASSSLLFALQVVLLGPFLEELVFRFPLGKLKALPYTLLLLGYGFLNAFLLDNFFHLIPGAFLAVVYFFTIKKYPNSNVLLALLFSSLMFTFGHYNVVDNLFLLGILSIGLFSSGLLFGMLRLKFNFSVAFLLHALNNGLFLVFSFFETPEFISMETNHQFIDLKRNSFVKWNDIGSTTFYLNNSDTLVLSNVTLNELVTIIFDGDLATELPFTSVKYSGKVLLKNKLNAQQISELLNFSLDSVSTPVSGYVVSFVEDVITSNGVSFAEVSTLTATHKIHSFKNWCGLLGQLEDQFSTPIKCEKNYSFDQMMIAKFPNEVSSLPEALNYISKDFNIHITAEPIDTLVIRYVFN